LAADVVGYSKLMAEDEAGTLAALKAHRCDVFDPTTAKHGGRVVKLMGDGVLVEFPSVVDAVQCALEIQKGLVAESGKIRLRIGINLGDVIVDGDDLYGDGVNVAARLEALAEPGGIAISGMVHEGLGNRVEATFSDGGEQHLKNLTRPIRVWHWSTERQQAPRSPVNGSSLPEKSSIAVLPFNNMSGDAEQEYFTDGLTEDIITDLSNVPGFFVIARNSTFSYKGKPADVRQIGRDLGVKYVLEGSARRAGQRLRVNVQLIDAAEGGAHIFAERFDRDLSDVFAVQDEIARRVVQAIAGRLAQGPVVGRYRPADLEVYDLYLKSRHATARSKSEAEFAREALETAIARDPNYPEAHAELALVHLYLWLHFGEDRSVHQPLALSMGRRAVDLDPCCGPAHGNLGFILMHDCQWDEAEREIALSVSLNPNDADCFAYLSEFKLRKGAYLEALELLEHAFLLNPVAPVYYYWSLGELQMEVGRFEDATKTLDRPEIRNSVARRHLAAALALSGRLERAKKEAAAYLSEYPDWTIKNWMAKTASDTPDLLKTVIKGYRLAGLPD
jgi:TolB-like protein/Tfp pilus assembly protein PilF